MNMNGSDLAFSYPTRPGRKKPPRDVYGHKYPCIYSTPTGTRNILSLPAARGAPLHFFEVMLSVKCVYTINSPLHGSEEHQVLRCTCSQVWHFFMFDLLLICSALCHNNKNYFQISQSTTDLKLLNTMILTMKAQASASMSMAEMRWKKTSTLFETMMMHGINFLTFLHQPRRKATLDDHWMTIG